MIIPAEINRKFSDIETDVRIVAQQVHDTVSNYCESKGHAYVGRIKAIDSLAEKIETGRFKRWEDLDDLFACAIIIPTLTEEDDVIAFLSRVFHRYNLKKRGSTFKPPEVFRFETTRFTGRLHRNDDAPNDPKTRISFEVQIRTAFEHAWSVTTHALAYKSKDVSWKSLRFAANLKAAVEQLDTLTMAYDKKTSPIIEHRDAEVEARRVVAQWFTDNLIAKRIPEELAPKDWSRFAENLCSLLYSSHPEYIDDLIAFVNAALAQINLEIEELGKSGVPRSISLMQFSFGTLAKRGFIKPPLHKYCPLVTSQLLELYPMVNTFTDAFRFDAA